MQGCTLSKGPTNVPFEQETLLALEALDFQQHGQIKEALARYETLYEKTKNPEYLKTALKLGFNSNYPIDNLLMVAKRDLPNDSEVIRINVGKLLNEGKVEKAKALMVDLVKREKNIQNLTILASIYFYQKDYSLSLKYYDAVYKEANDEASLLMMVELLDIHLGRTNEAISYLETHSRLEGCSRPVCYRLIQIYGKNKNIKGLISVYRRLYEHFGGNEYASKVVELLLYDNNRNEAILFLKKSNHDPKTLMQLYAAKGQYIDAFKTAKTAYADAGDLHYLGMMAVYEYEGAADKNSTSLLNSVKEKFETVTKNSNSPLYLNYYGYLLIDHDIDIQKGIQLVEKALIHEPQSPYYIDSLAWGYYKLNDCEKAMEIIEPIMDKTSEPEVLEHYKTIQECIRKNRDIR
jgi:hypothetical protein